MGKRKSAASAVNAIADAAVLNEELRVKALASLPKPVHREDIPLDACYVDRNLNFREDSSYDSEDPHNKKLIASLRENGQEPRADNPVWMEDGNGGFLTLAGNLRTTFMKMLRKQHQDQQTANPDLDLGPAPFETVFGLVYPPLTQEQRVALVADHGLKRDLSPYEWAIMIGRVMEQGYISQQKMAVHFGFDRNRVQRLWQRYLMKPVLEEYRKEYHPKSEEEGRNALIIGQEIVKNLYTAFEADRIAGEPNPGLGKGRNFRTAWETLLKNPDALKDSKTKAKQTQSKEDIANQVKGIPLTFGETDEVKAVQDVLRWASLTPDDNGAPVNLNHALDNLTSYCSHLRTENDKLRAEVETLRTDAKQFAEEISRLVKDLESERENVRIMEEENNTLRADLKSARESAEVK
jgi:hypothetical protein